MAELSLTAEEKAAATYLEWDDAAIGKAVKALAVKILDRKGDKAMAQQACAIMLACCAHDMGSETYEIDLEGVTERDEEKGDWHVLVTRKS